MKELKSRKELRSALSLAKFFTFDQEGKCATWVYGKRLCKVYKLSEKLQERVHDKLGKYFNGPGYLFIFKSIPDARKFIEVNLTRYEESVYQPDSSEIAYTLLMAVATTELLLQYDSQFLRIYLRHKEEGVVPELSQWRSINNCLKDMLLVTNNFINKE